MPALSIKMFVASPLMAFKQLFYKHIALLRNYFYFYRRLSKYSSIMTLEKDDDIYQKNARHLMRSHSIEKGLSLKYPKASFGRNIIMRLVSYLNENKNHINSNWLYSMIKKPMSTVSSTLLLMVLN